MGKLGRKPVLGEEKKGSVVSIIARGHSQRTAARYVGCAPSTIANTAARDAAFARRLRQARLKSEIINLERVQEAAEDPKYWRAASWILERTNPDDFGPKDPDVLAIDDLRQLLAHFVKIIMEEVTVAKYRKRLLKRLDVLTVEFRESLPAPETEGAEE